MRGVVAVSVGALAAVVVVAGCSTSAPKADKPARTSSAVTGANPPPVADPVYASAVLVRKKLDMVPVSDLVDAGNGVGLYFGLRLSDKKLFLRALDVATGKVRWQRAATPAKQSWIRPVVSAGLVGFASEPRSQGSVSATVVDIGTGDAVGSPSEFEGDSTFVVDSCGKGVFCLVVGPWGPHVPVFGPGATSKQVPNPYAWYFDKGQQVIGLNGDKEAWQVPAGKLWPFAASRDFEVFPVGKPGDGGTLVIEGVRQVPPRKASDIVTVGLSADDGKLLWKKTGFDALCNTIGPSGAPLGGIMDTACQWTSETKPAGDWAKTHSEDIPIDSFTDGPSSYTLVAYARRTGEAAWSDDSFGLPAFVTKPLSTDGDTFSTVSEDDRDDLQVGRLFLANGLEAATPPAGSTSWVRKPIDPYGIAISSSNKLIGQTRLMAVNSDGDETTPTWPIPKTVGVHAGSLVAIADGQGISTYRAPG